MFVNKLSVSILSFLVSLLTLSTPQDALAQAGGSTGGDMTSLILQLVIIFGIFYFLLIRPQQKKLKLHKEMTNTLSKGNKIVTSGGIIGVVTKASDEDKIIEVEISAGVRIDVLRSSVSDRLEEKAKISKVVADDKEEKKPSKAATKTKKKAATTKTKAK